MINKLNKVYSSFKIFSQNKNEILMNADLLKTDLIPIEIMTRNLNKNMKEGKGKEIKCTCRYLWNAELHGLTAFLRVNK